MENKLLTVVIPAYNSSSYLGKCLESLLVEDVMNDVEIIIVNDGSTDETLKIADKMTREIMIGRKIQIENLKHNKSLIEENRSQGIKIAKDFLITKNNIEECQRESHQDLIKYREKYKNYINEYNKYDTSSMSEDYNYCKKKSLSGIPKALIKYI